MSVETVAREENVRPANINDDLQPAAPGSSDGRRNKPSEALKRALDLVVAIPAAIFLLPIYITIAVVIYADDGGPVIFSQKRRGRNGKYFKCYKFRTMVRDAQSRLDTLLENNPELREEWAQTQKLKCDPRLTSSGGRLRRYSLDELPQMWNIIKGEMSIVGPRPIVDNEVPRYAENIEFYDTVRPGVLGLWQISGRNDVSYDTRVALDREYAERRTVAGDIMIMFRSIPAILFKRGAY